MKQTIQELLTTAALKYGEKTAVECGNKTLTYQELTRRSELIANYLLTLSVKKGALVGVFLTDRIELITAILGIFKAGAVFVPFDVTYPAGRLKVTLNEVDLCVIITDENNFNLVQELLVDQANVCIVTLSEITAKRSVKELIYPKSEPDDQIYIYFTSGSTGKPKGIIGRYKGLLHFIKWEIETFQLTCGVRISQFSSPAFDAFLRDLFVPLACGGTICIPDDKETLLNGERLVKWIDSTGVNLIHCVPSFFSVCTTVDLKKVKFAELKYVLLSGERINPLSLVSWYKAFGERIQLVNLYGPTETTMVKTFYFIHTEDQHKRAIPVGKAMKGAAILIFDDEMNLCKPGTVGEIYIRTPYMTLGYYKDPHLTAEKFLPNPFSSDPADLLYQTGDLGRFSHEDNLEVIGRKDYQVKIRGVRIEPGEIENQILGCPGVHETIVVDGEDAEGNKYLTAYVVLKDELTELELRKYLTRILPDFMIPTYIIKLAKLPLLPNGKFDRNALPAPTAVLQTRPGYLPPRNKFEEKLVQIWSKVLGIEQVGVNDNFFELGGHSLKAATVVAQIFKELKVEVPLKEIFVHSTLADLAVYIQGKDEGVFIPIAPVDEQEYYPLSSGQKRLYTLYCLDRESTGYNLPGALQVEGHLDLAQLEQALKTLIQRHSSLRTSFKILNSQIVQQIHPEVNLSIAYQQACEEDVAAIIAGFVRPFDLSQAPLLRVGVIMTPKKYILLYDLHHIIADRISLNILVSDLMKLYAGEELLPLRIQYKDFSVWQNQYFTSETFEKVEDYWLNYLAGELPVLNLPYDYPRPEVMNTVGNLYSFHLDTKLTESLNKLANHEGASLYMTLLAIYTILLARYSNQEDILIGSPIAGRRHVDLEGIIGMFVNTLVLRHTLFGELTFRRFLNQVKENVFQVFENQDYQFEMLVEKLAIPRDPNRNPFFDTMFALQNTEDTRLKLAGLAITPYELTNQKAHFDLTLGAAEVSDGIYLGFEYRQVLFKPQTIRQIANHLTNLVREITTNPDMLLSQIQILSPAEKAQFLIECNVTQTDYPKEQTIPEFFSKQVKQNPNAKAVIFQDQMLSYYQLDKRAGQLASVLAVAGVGPEQIVGLMVERSFQMVIGIMGILKAGGAYLPIESEYPEERIRYLFTDSGLKHLVVSKEVLSKLQGIIPSGIQLTVIEDTAQAVEQISVHPALKPHNLAYVIYTSGSTGHPKGVMIEQRSVLNLAVWFDRQYRLKENKKILQMTGISFDVAVEEIIVSLLNGAEIYLPTRETIQNPQSFSRFIKDHEINIVQFVPATLRELLLVTEEKLPSLRVVICGGDRLEDTLKSAILAKGYELYNHYGPTETTVDALISKCSITQVTLGKPIANTRAYILNNSNQLQPIGVVGELCIAGEGLARGYLHQIELTAERFVLDPFVLGARMYKTGDLARRLADGNIEFIGRRDEQVKIRGIRLELGEITTVLLSHPQIKTAAVLDLTAKNGEKYLGAYIVPKRYSFSISNDESEYYIVTIEQNPVLQEVMEELHMNLWPDFFVGDAVNVKYWNQVYQLFPDYQMAITDAVGNILAAANTVPLAWNGSSEDLPSGWDESIERAFKNRQKNEVINSLCAVAATVNTSFSSQGLSYLIIKAMNIMAATHGLDHAIYPVRPTLKEKYPYTDLIEYSQRRREDGLLFDPWLRVHERLNAKLIGYAPQSQKITGTVEQWEVWTNEKFPTSGEYVVKGSMQPVHIDLSANYGVYYDQAVWMEHDLTPFKSLPKILTLNSLQEHMSKFLPSFMLPASYVFLKEFPLTPSNKVDYQSLRKLQAGQRTGVEYVKPENRYEIKLAEIWSVLLDKTDIGIDDNFFTLGGHSLKATSLVSEVYKNFQVELPLREIFKTPTIRALAHFISNAKQKVFYSIPRADEREYYPTSSAQKRLYLLQQLKDDDIRYNISSILTIEGNLDQKRLEKAVKELLVRHESLRTGFALIDGEPVQKVYQHVEFQVEYQEVGETELAETIKGFIQPFNLAKPPLFRVGLIESTETYLIFDLHHIIADGVTMNILLGEFTELYQGKSLPELRIQYRDYAVWQSEMLKKEFFKSEEDYWLKVFTDPLPLLNLPTDYPRTQEMNFSGEKLNFSLDSVLTETIYQLAVEEGATFYMLLLAAYTLLLSRYSGEEDIIVGSPIAGRPHTDLEKIVGVFINTLAMRNHPVSQKIFRQFLREVKENALKAYEHQHYQFEMLVEKLDLVRDLTRTPLFDTMFVMQNTGTVEQSLPGLNFRSHQQEGRKVKFDLTLSAIEINGSIDFVLEYNIGLFKKETATRLINHFNNILLSITKDPDAKLAKVEMLTQAEKIELLQDFNATYKAFPAEKTLPQIFLEQAIKTPDQKALIFKDQHISYAHLKTRVEQLAYMLQIKGVKTGEIVGLITESSPEMIIGILAILRVGGAYLPIDPNFPSERIQYILADSETRLILTNCTFAQIPCYTGDILDLRDSFSHGAKEVQAVFSPYDIAYILYTSGSTGKPKGVLVEHRSVVNTLSHLQARFPLGANDILLQSTTITFDASVREIFWWFFNGATCCLLAGEEIKDPRAIVRAIAQFGITSAKFVPVMLNEIITVAHELGLEKLASLKYLFVGGEALPQKLVERVFKACPRLAVFCNLYGPTESTIHCTEYQLKGPIDTAFALIGRPISNNRIYILNSEKALQPIGVMGEIYVAGVGVARSYLHQVTLTAEHFLADPFFPGERMYRTGDLGRWLSDGNIEFCGRIDHQVKIRGFRIELGEIENQLLCHTAVKKAVVVALNSKNDDTYLCAYLEVNSEASLAELRHHLEITLPDYMLPAQFIFMDKLPLTSSGKIDRKVLPYLEKLKTTQIYTLPENETEVKLYKLWLEVLELEQIGTEDNFFNSGGHSLKAVQLTAKIAKEFNLELPLREIFRHPTIKALAQSILLYKQYSISREQPLTLLNEVKERNIFCFPPLIGHGIAYQNLAALLESHSVYAFDFIEDENKLEKYIDHILAVQSSGPYIFLGYSAGGNLAFEVAKLMYQKGYQVAKILILDAVRKSNQGEKTPRQIEENVEQLLAQSTEHPLLKEYLNVESVKKALKEKMKNYLVFLTQMVNSGEIPSTIFLIKASEDAEVDYGWHTVAREITVFTGKGRHREMLEGENLLKNAALIKGILDF